jgi:nucleoside-diphosphate-sugar epimerase
MERVLHQGDRRWRPIIHGSGNAWRLTRWGLPLVAIDLLDQASIARAIDGCTHVVNCSRGDDQVMIRGLSNLLAVCAEQKVQGFVHLSSVMVYGDPPAPDSVTEDGETRPAKGTYGWTKLKQDQIVQRYAKAGLPAIILCPPNITGPYSPYLVALVEEIRAGTFLALDGGSAAINIVDCENLSYAIELAIDRCTQDAPRLFVTDDEPTTWRELLEPMARLAEREAPVPTVTADELRAHAVSKPVERATVGRTLRHLVSSDVRAALRQDPLLAKVHDTLRKGIAGLGTQVENSLRWSLEGPRPVTPYEQPKRSPGRLCLQQLRGVRHACDRAKQHLGYKPPHSVAASMRAFEQWYRAGTGMDTEAWLLLRELFRVQ